MRSLGALLLIALATASCQGDSGVARPDIVIASAFSTTAFGVPARLGEQAVDFAVRQQSSIDGLALAYQPYDNSMGSEQNQLVARRNVRRMIADSSVLGVVGPDSSLNAFVELPEANMAPLAMVSPTATNECVTQPKPYCGLAVPDLRPSGSITFFRISPRDPLQGRAMADYAVTHLGVTKVAAFNEYGDQGNRYIEELSDELHSKGADLVYKQDLPEGTVKFSDFLKAAKNLGANAVYAVANGDQNACVAAQQMSALMPKAIFLTMDGVTFDTQNCIPQSGTSPPEIWATLAAVAPIVTTDPAVMKRAQAFLSAYPEKAFDQATTEYVLAAYDAARIVIEAIAIAVQANGGHLPKRSEVVTALATHTFVEATGTYTFDSNGDAVAPMMSVYRVQGSRWVFANVYTFAAQ